MSIATLLPERAGRIPGPATYTTTAALDNALSDIVRKIFVRPDGTGCQAVALIYARPEAGTSLLCASIANLLGDLHGKVLAISARELLFASGRRASGETQFVRICNSSVWVAPAPSGQSTPDQVGDLDISIATLRGEFDFLVIDGGAFFDLSRAEAIARHVDGFLVVVNEGATALHDLANVKRRIQKSGGRILGSLYSAATGLGMAGAR